MPGPVSRHCGKGSEREIPPPQTTMARTLYLPVVKIEWEANLRVHARVSALWMKNEARTELCRSPKQERPRATQEGRRLEYFCDCE